jgi:hypothetical protein
MIWQLNYFFNPPQFAFSPNLNFPVLPRIAFITGRIALIFQKPLFFTTFFRNFGRICRTSLYKGDAED